MKSRKTEPVSFTLILAADGNVYEQPELEARVARRIVGQKLSPGGAIAIATNVTVKLDENKLKNWAKQALKTWRNRLTRVKRVKQTLTEGVPLGMETGWFIERLGHGRYVDKKGNVVDERAFKVNIIGVPMEFVKQAGKALCREFEQESVLVIDNSDGTAEFIYC